jgi:hypothetical protein
MMAETKRFWCIHRSSMTKGERTRKKIIAATPIFTHGYESQKVWAVVHNLDIKEGEMLGETT